MGGTHTKEKGASPLGSSWDLATEAGHARGQAHPTSRDAVELPKGQVLHLVLLEAGRAGTVDGGNRGVGVCQPLHQPLHLAVTVKGIAPEVSGLGGRDTEGESLSCSAQQPPWPSEAAGNCSQSPQHRRGQRRAG